jgi:hypothetical protein
MGPSPSGPKRYMNPQARLDSIKDMLAKTEAKRGDLVTRVREIDKKALEASNFHADQLGLGDWFEAANPENIGRALDAMKTLEDQYPGLTLEPTHKLFIDPRADRFQGLLAERNLYRRMAFDYGYLNPITRLYEGLLAPVSARWLSKSTAQVFANTLSEVGLTPDQSQKFVVDMQKELQKNRSVTGLSAFLGVSKYRGVRALPEESLRAIMHEIAPEKEAQIVARWGSMQKMISDSANRLVRSVTEKRRVGGDVGRLAAAADGLYRIWQQGPGLSHLSSTTHTITKFLYPYFRFNMDPFWLLMNVMEGDILGVGSEGMRASRFAELRVPEAQGRRAMELSQARSIPPGGLVGDVSTDPLAVWDYGHFLHPRSIQPIMERHFDIARPESTRDFMNALPKEHPVAIQMLERFGDNRQVWADEAEKIMYGWQREGSPESFIKKAFPEELKKMGYTPEEMQAFAPVAERLAQIHRGVLTDLTNLYVGRMDRSNLERMADHMFVFWPLSYQVKASTWLFNIMFKKIGGIESSAGAYLFDHYRKRFQDAMDNDPKLRDMIQGNDDAFFMLDMMFPITPFGVGVNLSRPTRYIGSWLNPDIFGQYASVPKGDVPALVDQSMAVGPRRTLNLAGRIWQNAFPPQRSSRGSSGGNVLPLVTV